MEHCAASTGQSEDAGWGVGRADGRGRAGPAGLVHLASLDGAHVAVAWSLGFAWAAGVALPAWVPALLALTAWAVYIGDPSAGRSGRHPQRRDPQATGAPLLHHRHREFSAFWPWRLHAPRPGLSCC